MIVYNSPHNAYNVLDTVICTSSFLRLLPSVRPPSPYSTAAFFGFFVPYFERLVTLFPTPPYHNISISPYNLSSPHRHLFILSTHPQEINSPNPAPL